MRTERSGYARAVDLTEGGKVMEDLRVSRRQVLKAAVVTGAMGAVMGPAWSLPGIRDDSAHSLIGPSLSMSARW